MCRLIRDFCLTRNAKDLIDEYWRKSGKKMPGPPGRKSEARSSASAAKKRKPSPTVSEAEVEVTKKRGRPPKATSASQARSKSKSASDDDIEEVPAQKPKATRKATSVSVKQRKASPDAMDEDQDEDTYEDMRKWKDATSWGHLVDSIDTVERMENGKLYVYFRLSVFMRRLPLIIRWV